MNVKHETRQDKLYLDFSHLQRKLAYEAFSKQIFAPSCALPNSLREVLPEVDRHSIRV